MEAEIEFPAVCSRPARGARSDDNAYRTVVQAYNDFIAEEYVAFAPDRFFPIAAIPMISVADSTAEMKRAASLGLKGVMLTGFPSGKSVPAPEDDAFWAERAMNMPVTIHVDLDRDGARGQGTLTLPKGRGQRYRAAGGALRPARRG